MFNWTITYERNANINLPYGSYSTYSALKPDEQPPLEPINLPYKDRLVAWTVSNCGGLREFYVEQLRNHIRVDIFENFAYFHQSHLVEEHCLRSVTIS